MIGAIRVRAGKTLRQTRRWTARARKRVQGQLHRLRLDYVRYSRLWRKSLVENTRHSWRRAETAARAYVALFSYSIEGECVACPGCGSRSIELLDSLPLNRRSGLHRMGFVSGCRTCGIVFANPFPTPADLEALYALDGEWAARRPDLPSTKKPPVKYVKALFQPVEREFDVTRPSPGGRVLDVGCGNGELLDVFQDLGWETWGIEPAGRAAFRRHRECTSIPQDGSFDVVVLHHVLEHVAAPLEILCAIRKSLRPGGVVAVSVPRLDAAYQHGDLRYCIDSHTHVLAYTRDALATLLGLAGLTSVDVSPPLAASYKKRYMVQRLQMLGVNAGTPGSRLSSPLASAKLAFRRYYLRRPTRWRLLIPIRLRAGWLNRHRELSACPATRP